MSYGKRPENSYNQTAPAVLQNKLNNLTLTNDTNANNTAVVGKVSNSGVLDADQEALLAKERDLKFKLWLQNKSIKDKAFEYLRKLDSDRARDDDSLIEVGIAIAAIERMLGVEDRPSLKTASKTATNDAGDIYDGGGGGGMADNTINDNTNKSKEPSAANRKTLKSAWMKWAMEHHSFSMLILTDEDLRNLSEGVKEFLFSEADLVASSSGEVEEINRASKTKNILPSLKYFFPAVPKPNEKPRPLTNDQKAQNAIFNRELKKLWRRVKEELNNRIIEYVAKALKSSPRRDRDDEEQEKERKYKSSASLSEGGESGYFDPSNRTAKALEAQCLNDLSLKRLKEWIEEDEDKKMAAENESALQKLKEAKVSHEQFVRKKDGLRIRMPRNLELPTTGGMSHGREFAGVKPAVKGVRTTVELMAGSGLKYVHATTKQGLGGGPGDLEKSRELLLKLGHVHKDNFDKDKIDQYENEKRNNTVLVEKQKIEQKQKEDNIKAYEDWIQQKDLRDQASKCLSLIPKPCVDYSEYLEDYDNNLPLVSAVANNNNNTNNNTNNMRLSGGGIGSLALRKSTGSAADMSRLGGTTVTTAGPAQTPAHMAHFQLNHLLDHHEEELNHVIEIGKALKKVDRTLYADWAKWCDEVIPTQIAATLWDFFLPIACDVHSAVYSQVRATFLKLLRPGKDYKEVFIEYVEKNMFAKRVERVKQAKDYAHSGIEEREEIDKEINELKQEWLQDVALTKTQFGELLQTMGIVLKKGELNALFDAFDDNHDGVITLVEFLDFCGPKREKRAGNSLILSQRCCWLTTCKITGMANGYSISNPTKRVLKQKEESKQKEKQTALLSKYYGRDEGKDRDEDDRIDEEENYKLNSMKFTGKAVMKRLANGEMRVCIELKERQKREDVLRKLGLIDPSSSKEDGGKNKKSKGLLSVLKSKGGGGDEYEDDYEQDHDHEDDPHYSDDEDHDDRKPSLRGSKTGGSKAGSDVNLDPCSFSTWTIKQRREGLKYLLSITKEAREEELLKSLLSNGKPPNPPKFWIRTKRIARNMLLGNNTSTVQGSRAQIRRSGSRSIVSRSSKDRDKDRSSSRPRSEDDNYDEDDDHSRDHHDEVEDQGNFDDDGDLSTQLTLHWAPAEANELVSFYSVEFGGAVATTKKKTYEVKYYEIYRDPEDADLNNTFALQYTVKDLTPGTSYLFRIRAFNGFGPGEYTYKTFTTITTAPMQPKAIRRASDFVTLQWTFSKEFFERMDELKEIFQQADKDGSGEVDREELNAIFDDKIDSEEQHHLVAFLKSIAASKGIDLSQGYGALFDYIEADDDGGLSWEEFQNFFMSAGWTAPGALTAAAVGNPSHSVAGTVASSKSLASASNTLVVHPGQIVYVVEKCESEFDDIYREIVRTTAGFATINRLEPGQSYRFRVYSLNADEVPGQRSPDIVVHTLLETPAAPTAVPKTINAKAITISWKARNYITSTRHQGFIDKMVGDWAHSHGDRDGGVSIEAVFSKYDVDQSGEIDRTEFAKVLEDLGIPVTEERLFQAFNQLDADKSGTISFEEFGSWWRGDSVSYVLKRSNEVQPSTRFVSAGNREDAVSVTAGGAAAGVNTATSATSRPQSRGRYSSANTPVNMSAIPEEMEEQRSKELSAQNSRMDKMTASRANSVVNRHPFGKQVGVPVVSYRGTRTRVDIAGLNPNSLYYFKVRYVGARSNSILSPPLIIMTAPLAPSLPALIDVSCNTVRVKWYPSDFGAYKFAVHLRQLGSTRRAGASIVGQDLGEDGWIAVYSGPDNYYTCTTLSTETSYELRVCAVNFQGTLSEPSSSLIFKTLSRSDTSSAITAKTVSSLFTVECTGDICVGDTVLITERLFLRPKGTGAGNEISNAPDGGGAIGALGTAGRSASRGKARPSSASANKGGSVRGDANLAASVTSLRTSATNMTAENDGFISLTPSTNAQFIGERTFAAIVTKDNYRTARDGMDSRNISIDKDYKQFSSARKVWLQIIWQKSSNEVSKKYELKSGEILERFQNHLELFEVFRCPWKQEALRKSLKQEWEILRDCFIEMDA